MQLRTASRSSLVFLVTLFSACRADTAGEASVCAPCPPAGQHEALSVENAKLRHDLAAAIARIKVLERSPDALWAGATSSCKAPETAECVAPPFEEFLRLYPTDARAVLARRALKAIRRGAAEREAAALLDSVSVEQLRANAKRFKGRVFARELCCQTVNRWDGVFEATCFLSHHEGSNARWREIDLDSGIRLRMSREFAQRFAAQQKDLTQTLCAYRVKSTMVFRGEFDLNNPVFYLRAASF